MDAHTPSRLLTDRLFHRLLKLIYQYRYPICGTLAAGLLAYVYMFTNKLPNHDDLYFLFGKGATLSSGRWGLSLLSHIFPDYSMPWIYGIFTLLILSVCICLIIDLFEIRTGMIQALLAAVIITFPSQICIFAYMFTAVPFALSFLLSVVTVVMLRKGGRIRVLTAAVCMVLSLGIYQAYLAMSAMLLILLLLRDLLTDADTVGKLFTRGLFYVAFLVVSMLLYWGITNLLWAVTQVSMNDYAEYALSFSASSLAERIGAAYSAFLDVFRHGVHALIPTFASRYIHYMCFLAIGAELLLWVRYRGDLARTALLLFLLGVLPLGVCCMYVIFNSDSIHTLVLYPFAGMYILFACTAEQVCGDFDTQKCISFLRQLAREGIVVAMLVITLTNTYVANEAWLAMELAYENTYSVASAVIAQIQNVPGYTTDMPVAIMGAYERPKYHDDNFARLNKLMGTQGITPTVYSKEYFWEYYHDFPLNNIYFYDTLPLYENEEYQAMPSYPNAGFVKEIDGIIVVKFS